MDRSFVISDNVKSQENNIPTIRVGPYKLYNRVDCMEDNDDTEPFEYDFSSFDVDEHIDRLIKIAEAMLDDAVILAKSMENLEKEAIASPQDLEYYKAIRKMSEEQKENIILSLSNFYEFGLIDFLDSINEDFVTIKDAHMSALEIIDGYAILLQFLVTNEFHTMWELGSKFEELIKEKDGEIDVDAYKFINYLKNYRSDATLEVNGEEITEQKVVGATIYVMVLNLSRRLSIYTIIAKLILVAEHHKKKINWKNIAKKIIPILKALKNLR
ncbi:MAG: hypothetical protein ACXACP_09685 [Candidatus Hodarchaeales archaeon]